MDLYLIRHADALALGERGNTDDFERPLSDKGMAQSKQLGIWMQRKGIALDQVFTSPLVRAQQTAEGITRLMSPAPPLLQCPQLAPGFFTGCLTTPLKLTSQKRETITISI